MGGRANLGVSHEQSGSIRCNCVHLGLAATHNWNELGKLLCSVSHVHEIRAEHHLEAHGSQRHLPVQNGCSHLQSKLSHDAISKLQQDVTGKSLCTGLQQGIKLTRLVGFAQLPAVCSMINAGLHVWQAAVCGRLQGAVQGQRLSVREQHLRSTCACLNAACFRSCCR